MKKNKILNQQGITLIEIIVVITILAIMATFIGTRVFKYINRAKIQTARMQIASLKQALEEYRIDNGQYPTTEQGLEALIEKPATEPVPYRWDPEGYLEKKVIPKDPWGSDYIYLSESGQKCSIISLGADRTEGGEGTNADLSSEDVVE